MATAGATISAKLTFDSNHPLKAGQIAGTKT